METKPVPHEFRRVVDGLRRNSLYLDALLRGDEDLSLTEAAVFLNDDLLDDWRDLTTEQRRKFWRWAINLGGRRGPAKITFTSGRFRVELSLSDELLRWAAVVETLRQMLWGNCRITNGSLTFVAEAFAGSNLDPAYRDPMEAIEQLLDILREGDEVVWSDNGLF